MIMNTILKRVFTMLMAFALILEYGFSSGLMTAYAETGKNSYPAVTLSETVDGVKVTLEAPEGAFPAGTTMSVKSVDRQDVFDAVGKEFAEDGETMNDAVAFDVTPHDMNGKEIQPRRKVKLSFSGTGLDADDSGINVYRVSDDAKQVTEMETSIANADEQQFATDHFTIYVEGGSASDQNGDGKGTNHRKRPYLLKYGDKLQLRSDNSSIFTETWYISSTENADSLSIDKDTGLVTNTNGYPKDTLVEVGHSAGFAPFKDVDLNFWIQAQRRRVHIEVFFKDVGDDDFRKYEPGTEDRWAGEEMKLRVPSGPDYPTYKYVDDKIYVLDGWYTDRECTRKPSMTYDRWTKDNYPWFTTDTNIYGRYKEVDTQYAIIYNGNAEGCMDVPQHSTPKQAGSSVAEVRNASAHRPGYRQISGAWSADPKATVPDPRYTAYKQVDLAADPNAKNGVLVLYSIWDVYADISYEYDWEKREQGRVEGTFDWIRSIDQEARGSKAVPAKGYRFKEWRDSSGRVVSTEPEFVPERNEYGVYASNTYTACFEPVTYKVSFVSNSMTEIAPQTVGFEGKATKPEDPASDGCTSAAEWYSDKALRKPFSFDTVIDRDMTLYAKWDTKHDKELTEIPEKAASCTASGNIRYWTCEDCGRCYSDAAGKDEISKDSTVIAQLAHIPWKVPTTEVISTPNCVARGEHVERIYCTACNEEIYSNTVFDDPLGHDWGTWRVTREASVQGETPADGEKKRTCSRSGCDAYETAVIPAGEHVHEIEKVGKSEPSCTVQGKEEHYKCTSCGELFGDAEGKEIIEDEGSLRIPAKGHKTMPVVLGGGVAATCTTEGRSMQQKRCKTCGALLGSPEIITIPALGHDWELVSKTVTKEATCTENGSYEAKARCSRCDEEMVYNAVERAKGHTLTVHETAYPTCTENGHSRYWSCSTCSKLFSDEEGSKAVSSEDTVIASLGKHEPGEAVQENRVDATAAGAGRYDSVIRCIYCGEEISRTTIEIPKLETDEYNIDIRTSVEGSDDGNGGSVAGAVSKGKKGKTYRLTARPRPGFDFAYWLSGGKKYTDAGYDILVRETDNVGSVTVEAVFVPADLPYVGRAVLNTGETYSLADQLSKSGSYQQGMTWESTDTGIAKVAGNGLITAVSAGQARITGKLPGGMLTVSYAVIVEKQDKQPDKPADSPSDQTAPPASVPAEVPAAQSSDGAIDTSAGTSHVVDGSIYTILGADTAALTASANARSVSVPDSVSIGGKTFRVIRINAGAFTGSKIRTVCVGRNVRTIKKHAFRGSKATKLIVRTRKLTKKSVKGSLKGSGIRTVKVKVRKKKSVNKKYIKKYKKIFTKKNAGKKVTVKK